MEQVHKLFNKIYSTEYYFCEKEDYNFFPHNYVGCHGPFKNLTDANSQRAKNEQESKTFIKSQPAILPTFMQRYFIYRSLKPIVNFQTNENSVGIADSLINHYYFCKRDDSTAPQNTINCRGPIFSNAEARALRDDDTIDVGNNFILTSLLPYPEFLRNYLVGERFSPCVTIIQAKTKS
jgi:hypothetical protein